MPDATDYSNLNESQASQVPTGDVVDYLDLPSGYAGIAASGNALRNMVGERRSLYELLIIEREAKVYATASFTIQKDHRLLPALRNVDLNKEWFVSIDFDTRTIIFPSSAVFSNSILQEFEITPLGPDRPLVQVKFICSLDRIAWGEARQFAARNQARRPDIDWEYSGAAGRTERLAVRMAARHTCPQDPCICWDGDGCCGRHPQTPKEPEVRPEPEGCVRRRISYEA